MAKVDFKVKKRCAIVIQNLNHFQTRLLRRVKWLYWGVLVVSALPWLVKSTCGWSLALQTRSRQLLSRHLHISISCLSRTPWRVNSSSYLSLVVILSNEVGWERALFPILLVFYLQGRSIFSWLLLAPSIIQVCKHPAPIFSILVIDIFIAISLSISVCNGLISQFLDEFLIGLRCKGASFSLLTLFDLLHLLYLVIRDCSLLHHHQRPY